MERLLTAIVLGAALILLAACSADHTLVPTQPPPEPTSTPLSTATSQPTTPPPATAVPQPTFTPSPTRPAPFRLTLEDSNGKEVTFDAPAERIVAHDSAAVETLFAIGEGHRVIGTHSFVSYPPETESIAKVGDAFNLDIEAIVALEPDLVFVFYDRFNDDLERAGLKVLYKKSLSDDFTKIPDTIEMWGEITGSVDAAAMVAADFEQRVAAIENALAGIKTGPSVFQDTGGFWTPGQNTLMQAVFDLLKLDNIASDLAGYQQISPEVIVEKDPEIIIGDPEVIKSEAAFTQVRAVLDDRIFTAGTNALSVAGPRFIEGVEELARWVYPEIFQSGDQ